MKKVLFINLNKFLNNNIKPFSCEYCGKMFSRRDALRRHERMDSQGKRAHCSLKIGMAPVQFEPHSGRISPFTYKNF